jgi:hypothetical protein
MGKIKCPNCKRGQTNIIWEDIVRRGTEIIKEYSCGCGCTFKAIFEFKETEIIRMRAPR